MRARSVGKCGMKRQQRVGEKYRPDFGKATPAFKRILGPNGFH